MIRVIADTVDELSLFDKMIDKIVSDMIKEDISIQYELPLKINDTDLMDPHMTEFINYLRDSADKMDPTPKDCIIKYDKRSDNE